jgi:hypothetical protein
VTVLSIPFPCNVQDHLNDFKVAFAIGFGSGTHPNTLAWLRCQQGDRYMLDHADWKREYLRLTRVSRCGGKAALVAHLEGMEKPVALLANSPPPPPPPPPPPHSPRVLVVRVDRCCG